MIDGVTNADSLPVLERLMQFAGARHRLLAHDIANINTPGFRPLDVSPRAFQSQLGEAIDRRRRSFGNLGGALRPESTREIEFTADGVRLDAEPTGDNVLFHDGSDRDPERLMQALVENFMVFRTAAELARSRHDLLRTAISERV